jgi:hypothetical protein
LQHHTLPLYPLFGQRVLGRDCAEASVTASSNAVAAINTIIFIVCLSRAGSFKLIELHLTLNEPGPHRRIPSLQLPARK